MIDAPVIIVGGGPVGLAASLELARFGVPTVLIEQRETTSWHPKTRNINARTMEIARGWGRPVYERLRAIDTPDGWKSPIRFLRSVVGEELGQIESKGFLGPGPNVSPAQPVMSSQDLLEQVLFDAAQASELIDVRFGQEWIGLRRGAEPGARDVEVAVRDVKTGAQTDVTGVALVAADGAESPIREALGIALEGPTNIAYFVNCYFRADLEQHVGERRGVLFFVSNPEATGVFQPLDANGRWLCQIPVPEEDWSLDTYTPERCQKWIRAGVGVSDVEPEILSLGRWRMNATVATTLTKGRVVLCGDASHQFPPTGGLGVNTGLQGMHNAMWKLALTVQGKAGPRLLDTYNLERRPLARWIADQSFDNSKQVQLMNQAAMGTLRTSMSEAAIVKATRRYGNHLGAEFGASYESGAVVPDGTALPPVADAYSDYIPCARPGSRAPHVWLGRHDAHLSTIDLFGPGFTLLTGVETDAWAAAAAGLNRELAVPVAHYAIGAAGLDDRDNDFHERYGIDSDGAVLVRPDGYVAWRTRAAGNGSVEALERVMREILA